jgi:phage portal protein BeeE
MGLLGKFKEQSLKTETIETGGKYQSFSTPFLKVGKSNLSLPTVWDRYLTSGYVPFGDDNLFPSLLNQMYYTSPLHGSIVDFKVNASVGGGFEVNTSMLTAQEKLKYYTIAQRLNLDKLIVSLARMFVLHDRVYFLVCLEGGIFKSIKHLSPEKVRVNKDKTSYFISDDYYNNYRAKEVKPYKRGALNGDYILAFEDGTAGQDIYPVPRYVSALNFAFLSGELSYLSKSNIQNSVFPSFAMMFPKKPQSDEEMDSIKSTVNKMKGAENAGKAVAFFANNKEQLPELVSVPSNNNDKLFQEASQLNTEQICFAHTIDPILMGVRTTGSLGNGSDIKQSYVIFEKNVIMPLRARIEAILNDVFSICGVDVKLEINNYQIINETIIEVDEGESQTTDALNSMSPIVATKVLESMTPNEVRALAGLKPKEGGDATKSEVEQITAAPQNEVMTNNALRGLSAQ